MDKKELLIELENKKYNMPYKRFCHIVESFGFICKRQKGSHRIYGHKIVKELINIQDVNGEAKLYQIKQFIYIVSKYKLAGENK